MVVSIIMPYYNAGKYIKETVESIINQSYKDWELIIVDDCSSAPNTFEVLVGVLGAAYPRFLDIKISPCGLDAGVINARALILLTLKYKS